LSAVDLLTLSGDVTCTRYIQAKVILDWLKGTVDFPTAFDIMVGYHPANAVEMWSNKGQEGH
jgi:uncharacterized Fe-S radical SAM superfamily protein PflX